MDQSSYNHCNASRRTLLCRLALVVPSVLFLYPWRPLFAKYAPRELSFHHTHTNEKLAITYYDGGLYQPEALTHINHLLRDWRTDEAHEIDLKLLDMLHSLRQAIGNRGVFEVISGYRSSTTNATLRRKSNGVAKKSLHMQGRAIDVRLTDVNTATLRNIAIAMKSGGVGYYRKSNFVHLDTGRFRTW